LRKHEEGYERLWEADPSAKQSAANSDEEDGLKPDGRYVNLPFATNRLEVPF
jgi:hypothetical protein